MVKDQSYRVAVSCHAVRSRFYMYQGATKGYLHHGCSSSRRHGTGVAVPCSIIAYRKRVVEVAGVGA